MAQPTVLAHAGHAAELPAVEVTGHYDNSVGSSDAASQGFIESSLIKTRPALRPAEILEFIPGLIVTQHSGDGKANQYFLRGFNLDHGTDFATWVAGMPVNIPTHGHGHGYTDLNFLIPELVERIEYRKGPYFASNGDFASAGSADLGLFGKLPNTVAQYTLGQRGYNRLLAMASPTLANGATVLAAAEALTNNGPWTLAENLRKWNGVLRYTSGTRADGFDVTLMGYSARWRSTDQIPQRAVDSGQIGRFDAIDSTDGGRTERFSLSGQWRRKLVNGSVEASAYVIHYKLGLFSNFTYFLDRPADGDQFEQADRRNVLGGMVKRIWIHRIGELPMTNEIGLQMRQDRAVVGLYDSIGQTRIAVVREDRVRQSSIGAWYENGINWSSWFRTVAGLRFDQFNFNVDSNLAVNSGKSSANLVSPKFTSVFGPWQKSELFLNWGRGFHSNDARGTVTRLDPRSGQAVDPVPGLVRTTGYELGARTEIVPKLQSSIAAWRLDIGSELVFVGDAGTTEPSRPSRRQGIEFSNRYQPFPWLLFDLDLATSRARFRDDDPAGNQVPGSVSRVASAAVAIRDLGPWSASLQMRYLGKRPLIEDGSVAARPFALVNLRLGYRINKWTDVALDVFNLTNRRANDIEYYYDSQLRGEGAPVADRHFHPVEPRSIRATVRIAL